MSANRESQPSNAVEVDKELVGLPVDITINNALATLHTLKMLLETTMDVFINGEHIVDSPWNKPELNQLKSTILHLACFIAKEVEEDIKFSREDA
jgi:hypothetical protein